MIGCGGGRIDANANERLFAARAENVSVFVVDRRHIQPRFGIVVICGRSAFSSASSKDKTASDAVVFTEGICMGLLLCSLIGVLVGTAGKERNKIGSGIIGGKDLCIRKTGIRHTA